MEIRRGYLEREIPMIQEEGILEIKVIIIQF